jgi:adenylate cyclase
MDDPHYLALLAEAQLRAGALDAGLAAVAEALELARRERSLFYEPELHRLDAALHAAAGRPDHADESLRRGLDRAREQGSRALELRIATDMARQRVDPAGAAEARAAVAAVHAQFEEGFGTRDLRAAAAVLGPAAQSITPAPASASTSAPSATR